MPSRVTLQIVGKPGEAVTIYPESPLDAPPPPIFEGAMPDSGLMRLRVPRSPLLIVAASFGSVSVQFDEDGQELTVDVRPGQP